MPKVSQMTGLNKKSNSGLISTLKRAKTPQKTIRSENPFANWISGRYFRAIQIVAISIKKKLKNFWINLSMLSLAIIKDSTFCKKTQELLNSYGQATSQSSKTLIFWIIFKMQFLAKQWPLTFSRVF